MNFLQEWEINYRKEILNDLKEEGIQITLENIPLIIEKTSFKYRKGKYPDKCPYYSQKNSCHPEIEDLNCFLCPCPNYESDKLEGGCKIKSKKGEFYFHKNLPAEKIWDCSGCNINHRSEEIRKYLKKNIDNLFIKGK